MQTEQLVFDFEQITSKIIYAPFMRVSEMKKLSIIKGAYQLFSYIKGDFVYCPFLLDLFNFGSQEVFLLFGYIRGRIRISFCRYPLRWPG